MSGLNSFRIGRIPYANILPVYYGFDNNLLEANLNFINATPSDLNLLMLNNYIDISPMSTYEVLKNPDKFYILEDLSISCNGPVRSVILASHYLLENLNNKNLVLTDESSTSAHLLKVLLKEKGVSPNYCKGYIVTTEDLHKDCDATLIIGDKALKDHWKKDFKYVYDLGELWYQKFKTQFCFALWTVRRTIFDEYPDEVNYINKLFKKSKAIGLKNIKSIEKSVAKNLNLSQTLLRNYYDGLNYNLNLSHKTGLNIYNLLVEQNKKGSFQNHHR